MANKPHSSSDPEIHALIERRAYELSEQRGNEQGNQLEDWLIAEAEVLASLDKGTELEPVPPQSMIATQRGGSSTSNEGARSRVAGPSSKIL